MRKGNWERGRREARVEERWFHGSRAKRSWMKEDSRRLRRLISTRWIGLPWRGEQSGGRSRGRSEGDRRRETGRVAGVFKREFCDEERLHSRFFWASGVAGSRFFRTPDVHPSFGMTPNVIHKIREQLQRELNLLVAQFGDKMRWKGRMEPTPTVHFRFYPELLWPHVLRLVRERRFQPEEFRDHPITVSCWSIFVDFCWIFVLVFRSTLGVSGNVVCGELTRHSSLSSFWSQSTVEKKKGRKYGKSRRMVQIFVKLKGLQGDHGGGEVCDIVTGIPTSACCSKCDVYVACEGPEKRSKLENKQAVGPRRSKPAGDQSGGGTKRIGVRQGSIQTVGRDRLIRSVETAEGYQKVIARMSEEDDMEHEQKMKICSMEIWKQLGVDEEQMRSTEARIRSTTEGKRIGRIPGEAERQQGKRLQLGQGLQQEETRQLSTQDTTHDERAGEGRRRESEESTQGRCESRPRAKWDQRERTRWRKRWKKENMDEKEDWEAKEHGITWGRWFSEWWKVKGGRREEKDGGARQDVKRTVLRMRKDGEEKRRQREKWSPSQGTGRGGCTRGGAERKEKPERREAWRWGWRGARGRRKAWERE